MRGKRVTKKICMLGDFAVGKTSLIRRYVLDEFDDRYITTLGTKISKKDMNVMDCSLTFQIWDIIGNVKYNKLQAQYYRGSDGAFIIFDITRKDTFDNVKRWAEMFQKVSPNSKLVLIANKIDLEPTYDFQGMMDVVGGELDASLFTTSAKNGEHVEGAFKTLAERILETMG